MNSMELLKLNAKKWKLFQTWIEMKIYGKKYK